MSIACVHHLNTLHRQVRLIGKQSGAIKSSTGGPSRILTQLDLAFAWHSSSWRVWQFCQKSQTALAKESREVYIRSEITNLIMHASKGIRTTANATFALHPGRAKSNPKFRKQIRVGILSKRSGDNVRQAHRTQ